MTISIILALLACLALLWFIRLAKGWGTSPEILENPTEHIRSVDVEAFRNLMDPSEEEFLRAHLDADEFRKIQRERIRAAVDYVSGAAQNAAILLRLAEAARHHPNQVTAEAAEKLINTAIRLRLYAFQAIPRLYIAMVIPGRRISQVRVAEQYEQMTRQVVLLGLIYPTRGVSAVL